MLGLRQWRHGAFCVSRQHRLCRRWPRRTAKATPTTRDRGTEEQETGTSEALWSVLHGGKLTFISLPVSSPIHRSKSKFQLCTTARSIIKKYNFHANCTAIFVLCFLFFSESSGRNDAKYAFQYTFKNNTTQYAKKKKKKRKNNVWTFTTIFAVGHPSSS